MTTTSSDLGARLSTHRGSFAAGGWAWYVGAVLLLASVSWLVRFVEALGAPEGAWLEPLVTAGACVLFGALILLAPALRLAQSVDVFERGLVHRRPWGERTVRSDEASSVQHTLHRGRGGSYDEVEIALRDGSTLALTGLANSEQLVAFVRAWTAGPPPAARAGGYSPPEAGGWTPPT